MALSSSEAIEVSANQRTNAKYGWQFWAIIGSLTITSLLSALDVSVISTAMPSILKDLGSSYAYVWVANAYFLTMTAFQPLYGQTANIFGRRSLILLSLFLFAAGSAISGAAPNLATLIAGRAIQGIGGGGINILIEIVVADLVPLRERPKFISIIFIGYTIAVILGPLLGGLMAERVSWRWVFYINLPISALAFVMLALVLKVRYTKEPTLSSSLKRIDAGGNALLIASVVCILLALTWGGVDYPWSSWKTFLPLTLGIIGLGAFLIIESTIVAEPTMPMRLFSNRTSLGGFALTFLHATLMYCLTYFLPVYFQAVLETGAIISGINILPLAAVAMPFAMLAGFSTSKWGTYRPWFFLSAILFSICFGTFTLLDGKSSTAYWAGTQCIGAAAAGILTTTTLPAIQAPLDESDQAIATATWGFVRSFGGIWGVAIPAAVFNSRVNELIDGSDELVAASLADGGAYALASMGGLNNTGAWSPELKEEVKNIYVDSLKRCWQVAIGLSLLAFLISFVVKDVKLRTELETRFGLKEKEPKTQDTTGVGDEECHQTHSKRL